MATKDWAAPLVAALVTFAGLLALPDQGKDEPAPEGDSTTTTSHNVTHADLLFPFKVIWVDDPGSPSGTSTSTAPVSPFYSPGPTATTYALLRPVLGERDPCPMAHASRFERGMIIDTSYPGQCLGPGIARYSLPLGGASNGGSVLVAVAPDGPRLGQDGYNATRVTLHAFNEAGELIASNGNASEQARLGGGHSPQQLPSGVWYLGANSTVPPGTQPLPATARTFLPQLRGLLTGLPVGGVATTQTDALRAFYGTLYVTAQVDELVHAP